MTNTTSTTRRRGATSRRGGEPVVLPSESASPAPPRQMTLALDAAEPHRVARELMPGVVLVPGWLSAPAQRALAQEFRAWALPPAGLRHPRVPTGQLMSVQSVCLGWHWHPYAYTKTADDTDGAPVKPLPVSVDALARSGGRRGIRRRQSRGNDVRAGCRDRQSLPTRCPAGPAPRRRGAVRRAGRDHQPR